MQSMELGLRLPATFISRWWFQKYIQDVSHMFGFTLALGDQICNDKQCSNGLTAAPAPVMFFQTFVNGSCCFHVRNCTISYCFINSGQIVAPNPPSSHPKMWFGQGIPPQQCLGGEWWFQFLLIFTPTWGNDPI